MSRRLLNRYIEVRAGLPGQPGLAWSNGLQMTFEVTKTARRGSNKATIKIWNLSDASVGHLEQTGTVVDLIAGYDENFALLFSGDVAKRGVTTTREGKDRITTIEAGNKENALREARSDFSLAPDSGTDDVIRRVADKMGVGVGNVSDLVHRKYLTGFVHSGLARDVLDRVSDDLGVRWSIQNGQLQFLGLNETTKDTAVLLTPRTGLIGAPGRTKDGLEAVSLMNPEIFPGRLVKVESETIKAFYKVTEVTHTGDYRGGDWFTKTKGKKVPGQ